MLPYAELLPRTSVMVTNGGYGGVQIALSHGVPLVVAGTTEDKPEVAARVAWSGSGINLRSSTPTAEALRRAVQRVLAEPSFRQNAQRLSREFAQYDAVALGTKSIEALIGTAKPRESGHENSSPAGSTATMSRSRTGFESGPRT
jgi:UDP:flavonoid glycosyltransferase YjiC (YdhE family)